MKKSYIYLCAAVLAMVLFSSNVYAQNEQDKATEQKQELTVKNSDKPLDAKMSKEEQERILNAGKDNPAKIKNSADPKLSREEQKRLSVAGEDNPSKPQQMIDKKQKNIERIENIQKSDVATPKDVSSQPPGEEPKKVTNYRSIKGPNTQPPGKDAKVSPRVKAVSDDNTQPGGDKPNKQ